jgi:hypothetical protein
MAAVHGALCTIPPRNSNEYLAGESEMIRSQMRKHNRPVTVAMYGAPCAIPPRKH